jgi:hypothetical protein
MRPALERRDALANEAGHYVLRSEASIPQLALNPVDGVNWHHGGLRVIGLVLHLQGWLIHEWRQVEQIHIRGILDIEEALLPLLTGL